MLKKVLANIASSKQVLLVKVTLENGKTTSKKKLFRTQK
jgi:hypothetical protein